MTIIQFDVLSRWDKEKSFPLTLFRRRTGAWDNYKDIFSFLCIIILVLMCWTIVFFKICIYIYRIIFKHYNRPTCSFHEDEDDIITPNKLWNWCSDNRDQNTVFFYEYICIYFLHTETSVAHLRLRESPHQTRPKHKTAEPVSKTHRTVLEKIIQTVTLLTLFQSHSQKTHMFP